jgi:hypothetical protein
VNHEIIITQIDLSAFLKTHSSIWNSRGLFEELAVFHLHNAPQRLCGFCVRSPARQLQADCRCANGMVRKTISKR